ncbi:MAG: hypothetical protein CL910_12885 [Deltaproteobacteria bacterium]|jgi:hypothetical protein|nr:hypothetical protein [Deltaproteobacteria bacterium]
MSNTSWSNLMPGVAVALGIAFAGAAVADGLAKARAARRVVTVKGLAEREVDANLALWPIVFQARGDVLAEVHAEIEADTERVLRFLHERGFADEEIARSEPRVTDHGLGRTGEVRDRFSIEATLAVRSPAVARVTGARQAAGKLVGQGIELVQSYEWNTQYLFTGLDELKPEMIAAATRDARRAAQQFAEDSGSAVGSIRNAQQGYFSIANRDAFSPQKKRVRVVTTIQYFLTDD